MGEKTLSDLIVEQCAPTLAGMKCGSLFNYRYQGTTAARQEMRAVSGSTEMERRVGVGLCIP